PTGTLPTGNLLFIAPPHSTTLFDVTGVVTTPVPLAPAASMANTTGAGDPLLRFLDLTDLHLARAQQIPAPNWAHTVLDSDQGPLIRAGETGGHKIAILTFDIHDSDLPVQMAFPLLVRNLVGYLLPEPAGGLPASVSAGSVLTLNPEPDAGITRLTVEAPNNP